MGYIERIIDKGVKVFSFYYQITDGEIARREPIVAARIETFANR